MSSYKYLNSRQILNVLALPNIGAPANDSLDDILNKINAAIGGLSNNIAYIANNIALTSGSTSYTVDFPARLDLSFVAFAMMVNETDADPQYQQVQMTAKTVDSATFEWNAPLESSNYSLDFILMPMWIIGTESAINSGASTVFAPLNTPQNGPNYAILGAMENLVDEYPQFQTPVVINQSALGFVETFNTPTSSANYVSAYISNPTEQIAVPSGVTTVSVTLPVAYGSSGYAVLVSLSDVVDPYTMIQPLIITAKSSTGFTVSWNSPLESSNYLLTYYAVSLTT